MIGVRRFDDMIDFDCVEKWMNARGLPVPDIDELPAIGLLAHSDYDPVAVQFMRVCEGKVGMLDSMVSDPEKPADVRDMALDLLSSEMMRLARCMGIGRLIAFTTDDHTLKRALKHGFERQPHWVVTAQLAPGVDK